MKGNLAGLCASLLLAGCATEMQRADRAEAHRDYQTALADYQDLAASGDAVAERKLAYMYYSGLGVGANEAEAQRWYEKAALDGDSIATYIAAWHFLPPDTVPPDYAQAFKWLKLCADRYDHYCELQLSIYYENGLGVPRDPDAARHWLDTFVGQTNVTGASSTTSGWGEGWGADNTGGFMVAMEWALYYSPHYKDTAPFAGTGPVWLGFGMQDGRATEVHVLKSSGNPEADAAAVSAWQKTPLPPVLASLRGQPFAIQFKFGSTGPGVVGSSEYLSWPGAVCRAKTVHGC